MNKIKTWINVPENSDFSIYNLPFGIFSLKNKKRRVGIAIGTQILDVYALAKLGHIKELNIDSKVFKTKYLNDFISLGKEKTNAVRLKVQELLSDDGSPLRELSSLLIKQEDATMHLPVKIGDYTDFYSSIEHATNVGSLFRDPENALMPNWRHLPVGYHGRSSSIIVSGVDIHRPKGQTKPADSAPIYQASQRMDFELEMGYIIGKETKLGDTVTTDEAEEYIFGKVLFNDWTARDIQVWEYIPLGPFLGKNFASSISPWIVTLEALEPFRVETPEQKPAVLPYLETTGLKNYDIKLEVAIQPQDSTESIVCKSNFKYMYWSMAQQIAHHTVNGCNLNVGDMMASGTISGKTTDSYGSMLEISKAGKQPITSDDGEKRSFIHDFDTVIMRGYAKKDGIRVGFGEVKGMVLPSI